MKPYWSNGITQLFHADARQVPLPDQSVHCVVTSPPYFGLRVYKDNDGRGIGLEASVDAYLDSLMEVMAEVWRVLRDDGILWVNLGDSYGGSGGAHQNGNNPGLSKSFDRSKVERKGDTTGQLLGIPWRFALRMQEAGWILRQDVIWAKDAPMPESLAGTRWERCRVKVAVAPKNRPENRHPSLNATMPGSGLDSCSESEQAQWSDCPGCPKCEANDGLVLRRGSWRCTEAHEYIFQFVKSMGYWSDGEAVKTALNPATVERAKYSIELAGGKTADDFGISKLTGNMGGRRNYADTISWSGANRRSVWKDIKPEPFKGQHYATFPSSLPRICIQASTSEAGCCPTCGAQWARVVDHTRSFESGSGKSGNMPVGKNGAGLQGGGETLDIRRGPVVHTDTLAWRPTCSCPENKPVSSTVFDPFGGTGTTCVAAQRLGRHSVMTDLSTDYLKQAEKRLAKEMLPLGAL